MRKYSGTTDISDLKYTHSFWIKGSLSGLLSWSI